MATGWRPRVSPGLDQVPGRTARRTHHFTRATAVRRSKLLLPCRRVGNSETRPAGVPFFFLKTPTTSHCRPDALIPIPKGDAPNFDWEAELGVVIGKGGKNIPRGEARSHVAGYVVANDLSARGTVSAAPTRFHRCSAYDWVAHKSQETGPARSGLALSRLAGSGHRGPAPSADRER